MQLANGILVITPDHQLAVRGVTPAEALVLYKIHFNAAKGAPLKDFVVVGEEERKSAAEFQRLVRKYHAPIEGKPAAKALFGDGFQRLPQTFDEIEDIVGIKFTVQEASAPAVVDEPVGVPGIPIEENGLTDEAPAISVVEGGETEPETEPEPSHRVETTQPEPAPEPAPVAQPPRAPRAPRVTKPKR